MELLTDNSNYDVKSLKNDLMLWGLLLFVMKITNGIGFLLFFFWMTYAILEKQPERMLVILLMTCCVMVGNAFLFPKGMMFNILQKVMFFFMAIVLSQCIHSQCQSRCLSVMKGFTPYLVFMSFSSLVGWNPIISFLKLFLFIVSYYAMFKLAENLIQTPYITPLQIRSALLSLFIVFILGSAILIPFPGISQMANEDYIKALISGDDLVSRFCGITFQPQTLGPLVAVIGVVILCDIMFYVRRMDRLMCLLLAFCPVLIFKTSSRTAMGSLIAGILFATFLFTRTKNLNVRWKKYVINGIFILGIVLSIFLFGTNLGIEGIVGYISKSHNVDTLQEISIEEFISSRQGLMENSFENFKTSPLIGNGFQISKYYASIEMSSIRSILSAPIEKGVWITAVLEEGGIIGMLLFVGFGIMAIYKLISLKAYISASVLFTIYVINLGEFTFFSMSGIGGFYWCLLFLGIVIDERSNSIESSTL